MLLYHFPLNTADNISNFTNVGLKNDYTIENNANYSIANIGKISASSILLSGRSLKIPIQSDIFTIAMRVKFPSTLIDSKFLYKIYNGSNTSLKSGPYTWNALGLQLDTTTIVDKTNTDWFDLVTIIKDGEQKTYVNSVLKLTQTTALTGISYVRLLTGTINSQEYNGYIQDIRIYDYALSLAEINEYSKAMVVHYTLNGNVLNSNVIKDCSGLGNDYTSTSAITYRDNSPRYSKYGVVTKELLLQKGKLVNIRQLVENYDFSDGLNHWIATPSNDCLSLEGDYMRYTCNRTDTGIMACANNVAVKFYDEDDYCHLTTVRFDTEVFSGKQIVYNGVQALPITNDNILNYGTLSYNKKVQTASIPPWSSIYNRHNIKYMVFSIGKGLATGDLSFAFYHMNVFDKTDDFGKNNEPTHQELYNMLGMQAEDFIPYGNYVVEDTRKIIPKTISFWCQYNGTWYHLAYNGDRYVNGEIATDLFNTIYASLEDNICMSDFRVYASTLSAADIQDLYNAPIHLDNQHTLQCSEVVENAKYPSKYWRTPTYTEMNYLLNSRTNASNLRTLGRVNVNGTYINGCFLLPDDWVTPAGIDMTITTANYTTNSYSLVDFDKLENNGAVFFISYGYRNSSNFIIDNIGRYWTGSHYNSNNSYYIDIQLNQSNLRLLNAGKFIGRYVRLCVFSQDSHSFSTSSTTKIKFAKSNLQYHCTQHIWRFAENQYDFIGAANANISDSYNGWIDLFGYGTSGVHYSPTLHSTNNADYASGDISNTDNDWGVNEIESYDYNVASNKVCKTGVVGHNEIGESYESIVYPSNTWRTPTYAELNYLLNTRTNASNLKTFIRLSGDGWSRRGVLLLPDDWIKPADANLVIVSSSSDDQQNAMDEANFNKLINAGAVFLPRGYSRWADECYQDYIYWTSTSNSASTAYNLDIDDIIFIDDVKIYGCYVRLCRTTQGKHTFSASAGHSIELAYSNLQYHCTEHKWRFAPNAWDRLTKSENESISPTYDGWIDLFGYGTSGKTFAPTLISTSSADYAQGNLNGTDNDWGVNEIIDTRSVFRGLYKDKLILDNITED